MPRVSVVLTSYNHEKYVGAAIESVLRQTYDDFELIIVDDGSTDKSQDIIREYAAKDGRIKTILHEENLGAVTSFHGAVKTATGEYLAVAHSDDLWKDERIQKQIAFMDEHREYAACFSYASFVDENGDDYEPEEGNFYHDIFKQENRSCGKWLQRFFFDGNCLCHPSLLIRREMYEKHGLFDFAGVFQLPDALMWTKLAAGGENIYVYPEVLVKFRLRRNETENNTSGERPDKFIRLNFEYINILREFAKLPPTLFAEVFPDYTRFIFDGKVDFALAKVCLTSEKPAYRLFGLILWQKLLQDSERARRLKELFGFDEHDFIRASGETDCFSLKKDMRFADMKLVFDYGDGFDEEHALCQKEYVRFNGSFAVKFVAEPKEGKTIRRFYFQPDADTLFAAYLTDCAINGKTTELAPKEAVLLGKFYFADNGVKFCGELSTEGTTEIFLTGVIWHFTPTDALNMVLERGQRLKTVTEENEEAKKLIAWHEGERENHIKLLAWHEGERENHIKLLEERLNLINDQQQLIKNHERDLAEMVKIIDWHESEKKEYMRLLDERMQLIEDQRALIEKMQISAKEKDKVIADTQGQLRAVLNSSSWKITAPLRNVAGRLRRK